MIRSCPLVAAYLGDRRRKLKRRNATDAARRWSVDLAVEEAADLLARLRDVDDPVQVAAGPVDLHHLDRGAVGPDDAGGLAHRVAGEDLVLVGVDDHHGHVDGEKAAIRALAPAVCTARVVRLEYRWVRPQRVLS